MNTAYLFGVYDGADSCGGARRDMDEFARLVETTGLSPVACSLTRLRSPHSATLLGSGRVHDVVEDVKACKADVVGFDGSLTPTQQRNWSRLVGVPVVDRYQVILNIFALHARTTEAKLQVELAQVRYELPRLTRAWTHLSRQRGGGGTTVRGSGETQLEVDRRRLQSRLAQLTKRTEEVRRRRGRLRSSRADIPTVALVGYTNAGKSSLLRALTGAAVLVRDQVFATLDPTTRRVELRSEGAGLSAVITDTVGFVRNLPHDLVEAFQATLGEVREASLLVHVVDGADEDPDRQFSTTRSVLREIGAEGTPTIVVINKADILDEAARQRYLGRYGAVLFVSAQSGAGLDELASVLHTTITSGMRRVRVSLPVDRSDLVAYLHRVGSVVDESYTGATIEVEAFVPESAHARVCDFTVDDATPVGV